MPKDIKCSVQVRLDNGNYGEDYSSVSYYCEREKGHTGKHKVTVVGKHITSIYHRDFDVDVTIEW